MTLAVARDISLIILIVPMLICALVPSALVFGAWWMTRRTCRALPPRFQQARSGIRRVRDGIDRVTRTVTAPIFSTESQSASVRAIWRATRGKRREN